MSIEGSLTRHPARSGLPRYRLALLASFVVLIPLCLFIALKAGGDDGLSAAAQAMIFQLRLERAIAAFAVGSLLALAGALMQTLLRNPLADPYVLGVSGGAAAGALIAMLLGTGTALMTGSAFAGALLSITLVFGLNHGRPNWTPMHLLLTGIVVAMGWGALISLILAIAPNQNLRSMLFWLMGDLSYSQPGFAILVPVLVSLVLCLGMARSLNILALGQHQASLLGVEFRQLHTVIYVLASLLTALAVTIGGSIGFIGLVVPHLSRLIIGSDHRFMLPLAVGMGGCLLMLADTLAHHIASPLQLPVGAITAALGVPLFLYLLLRHSRQVRP